MSQTSNYTVQGMTCQHCVEAVRREIGRIEGVTAVQADLASGAVAVTADPPVTDEAVDAAVEEAGYELVSES